MSDKTGIRIAVVGDIHVKAKDHGKWQDAFRQVSEQADVLLLCGDLTDTGLKEEAEVLVGELEACSIPVLAVLGNHDYESGKSEEVIQTLQEHLHLLDGDTFILGDVGFTGVKGFGGGFNRYKMPAYGEEINKEFVRIVKDEAAKLDRGLQKLDQKQGIRKKVVLLHYSPLEETVVGEPEQIFPFLGSTYLLEPLEKHKVALAFHGHAHIGTLEAATPGGCRVFNVAYRILKDNGFKLPFYMIEV